MTTRARQIFCITTALAALGLVGCGGGGGGGSGAGQVHGGLPLGSSGGPPPRIDAGPPDPGCQLPVPIDDGLTYSSTLHVANGGNDTNDGSTGSPLATIRAAAERAEPGTEIVVRAGTYPAVVLGRVQGQVGRPIAFRAEGDVLIDASSGVGWAMSDAAYVVIDGFTIANAMIHGMNIDDGGSYDTPAHHIVLRNLTVRDTGSGGNNDCIKMSGVDDFWVLGSDISGANRGELIDMVGCHRGVISGNRFHDTAQNGVQTKGGSADTIIHANVFENIPGRAVNMGGSTGVAYLRPTDAPYEAARIRVVSNIFINNGAMGATVAYVGCDACTVAHNTFVRPKRWVARVLQESTDARFVPSRNGLFVNNLLVFNTGDIRSYINVGSGTAPETFTFSNNLWFAMDEGAEWAGPDWGGSGVPAETDGLVQMDPLMVDRAGGDYRLTSGSPAQMAGRALDFGLPADNDARCYATPATLGAFEIP